MKEIAKAAGFSAKDLNRFIHVCCFIGMEAEEALSIIEKKEISYNKKTKLVEFNGRLFSALHKTEKNSNLGYMNYKNFYTEFKDFSILELTKK